MCAKQGKAAPKNKKTARPKTPSVQNPVKEGVSLLENKGVPEQAKPVEAGEKPVVEGADKKVGGMVPDGVPQKAVMPASSAAETLGEKVCAACNKFDLGATLEGCIALMESLLELYEHLVEELRGVDGDTTQKIHVKVDTSQLQKPVISTL